MVDYIGGNMKRRKTISIQLIIYDKWLRYSFTRFDKTDHRYVMFDWIITVAFFEIRKWFSGDATERIKEHECKENKEKT